VIKDIKVGCIGKHRKMVREIIRKYKEYDKNRDKYIVKKEQLV
jgi:hypothetical protein